MNVATVAIKDLLTLIMGIYFKMGKVKEILEITRQNLAEAEGDTLPKEELLGALDNLINTMPMAQALDEKQLDIMTLYMNALNNKLDLLFIATSLCGIGIVSKGHKKDKVDKEIHIMQNKKDYLDHKFTRDMLRIVDPEGAAELDKKDEELRKRALDTNWENKVGQSDEADENSDES